MCSLPRDMLRAILSINVKEDPSAYPVIRLCCKEFKEVAEEPEVARYADLSSFRKRLNPMSRKNREWLTRFAEAKNTQALTILGTRNLFIANLPRRGIRLLKEADSASDPIGTYILGVALIHLRKKRGQRILSSLFEKQETKKKSVIEGRKALREMVPAENLEIMIGGHVFCRAESESHWDGDPSCILYHDRELQISCPNCCVEVELFKLHNNW